MKLTKNEKKRIKCISEQLVKFEIDGVDTSNWEARFFLNILKKAGLIVVLFAAISNASSGIDAWKDSPLGQRWEAQNEEMPKTVYVQVEDNTPQPSIATEMNYRNEVTVLENAIREQNEKIEQKIDDDRYNDRPRF